MFTVIKIKKYKSKKYSRPKEYEEGNREKMKARNRVKAEFLKRLREENLSQLEMKKY